jgi:uncharacterized Zn finger protein
MTPHRDEVTGIMMHKPVSQIECYECGEHGTFVHRGAQMVCDNCGHVMGKPVNKKRQRRLRGRR